MKKAFVLMTTAFIAACSAAETTANPTASDGKTIEVMHVTTNTDGTQDVRSTWLTPDEAAQMAARHSQAQTQPSEQQGNESIGSQSAAIINDTGCSSTDLMLFNATTLVQGDGTCHPNGLFYKVLCFNSPGTMSLSGFQYCYGATCFNWNQNILGVGAGPENGYLYGVHGVDDFWGFNAYSCQNTVNHNWISVTLNN